MNPKILYIPIQTIIDHFVIKGIKLVKFVQTYKVFKTLWVLFYNSLRQFQFQFFNFSQH